MAAGHQGQRPAGHPRATGVLRQTAESVLVVAAGCGLALFGTFGTFEDGDDLFPHSVAIDVQ